MELDIADAFAELGLSPQATEHEIKSAWRRLVSQWHPDRNTSASAVARMQRINLAFKAIRLHGFRTASTAAEAQSSQTARPHGQARPAGGRDQSNSTDDADAAGRKKGRDESTASRDDSHKRHRTIHRKVRLTLEEAAAGCTRVLNGRTTEDCATCDGAGYQVLGGHCPQCQGSGAVRRSSWFDWIGTESECEACHGGGIARKPCMTCDGCGKAASIDYKVSVRIPAGVRDGDQLHVDRNRLKPAASFGDLGIRVEVQRHDFLQLDADGTIRCEMPIDGFAWIANRSVEVPTLHGLRSLRLHRDRLVYRLAGQGFPLEGRGPPGDQLISVTPVFPDVLNSDQEILLDQLIASRSKVDARLQRWNEKVKAWRARDGGNRA